MAKQTGWIKLYRQIMEGHRYFSHKFCPNMAWIDLLMLANHKPAVMVVRGIAMKVNRGQVGYSTVSLARRWKWSRGKVERFLSFLEMEQQISQQKNRITTLISVLNYEQYQEVGQQNEQQTGQQTGINKNEKNEKKKRLLNTKVKTEKVFDIVLPAGWDSRFETLWHGYRQYRTEEGKGWYRSPKTEQQAVNGFWKDCAGDFDTAYKMMDLTIRNRWSGLFPLKNNNNGQPTLFAENGQRRQSTGGKTTDTLAGIATARDF